MSNITAAFLPASLRELSRWPALTWPANFISSLGLVAPRSPSCGGQRTPSNGPPSSPLGLTRVRERRAAPIRAPRWPSRFAPTCCPFEGPLIARSIRRERFAQESARIEALRRDTPMLARTGDARFSARNRRRVSRMKYVLPVRRRQRRVVIVNTASISGTAGDCGLLPTTLRRRGD